MSMYWNIIYGSAVVCGLSGFALWFLFPKKWIVWSRKAAELLPQETFPPWRTLNKVGKSLHMLFYFSAFVMLVLLLAGVILEYKGVKL